MVQKRLWPPLLTRLQRRKTAVPLGSSLLVECVNRLAAEAADVGADGGGTVATRSVERLRAIRRWALLVLSIPAGAHSK